MSVHQVIVSPLPSWVPAERWLGEHGWELWQGTATAELGREEAADLDARLRNVALAGLAVDVQIRPRLKRPWIRDARAREARRLRNTSVGFSERATRLDEQGRFSLTPEQLALELGQRFAGCTVVDATCGAGGNAIGFARAGCKVIAIDAHKGRLADAEHNARVYGVQRDIRFLHGDATQLLQRCEGDLLFVDPPWGETTKGPSGLAEHPLLAALWPLGRFTHRVAKMPSGFDPTTLAGARPEAVFGCADGDRQRIKFLLLHARSVETTEASSE